MKITFIGILPSIGIKSKSSSVFCHVSVALLTGWFQAELLQLINKFLDDYEIAYKSAKMTAHCKKWQKNGCCTKYVGSLTRCKLAQFFHIPL